MNRIRRKFLLTAGATGMALTLGSISQASDEIAPLRPRRFKFVHIDVFTLQPLLGNPLDVFLDARGMSDAEMLAVTRETYLNEATFVFPRDPATEREHGISVRIFTPDGEVPFAGHPTLGTATVLRNLRLASKSSSASSAASLAEISLDLKVGKVPVTFLADSSGHAFGEMRQVAPKFGALHDKDTVAQLHNLVSDEIADYGPIQTVSTGLPFAIVPLKRLASLQSLRVNAEKMNSYVAKQEPNFGFYYVTRDAVDSDVALRARCIYVGGEDAATGSAAGCAAAWLVRYGAATPEQSVHIRQGVEMKRTSDIFVRASRDGDKIVNVRVGGYAVETMEGEIIL
ncbi:MAG: trans-2,3-dihydro-3-hydroxyanthranilate isomerase [Gammaproteobacteria bacterium]|jgi:trans-2,3-dihydro-3-hydroxyanthranilate isomerase|nr:trans-2,3-dihydro-3-hydroxyanthranilate isomerase [Gammaproteobacteria bacterium]